MPLFRYVKFFIFRQNAFFVDFPAHKPYNAFGKTGVPLWAMSHERTLGEEIQMNAVIREIETAQLKASVPAFKVGDTVRVHGKIVEGTKERIQVFEGVVIKRQNGGVRETFTVRRLSSGIGVEKTWPLHSPRVENVEVVRRGVVRRAKLFYLRDRIGKAAKVKEEIYKKDKK